MRAHEFTDQGAAGIVLYAEDTGRYGLQQRSDSINDGGLWAAWGGGREPGESLEQCALRELAEEGGYSGPIKLKRIGENVKYVTFIGVVPHEFEPRANDEWQDYCWVEAGDWPEPMHPGTAAALKNIPVKQNVAEAFDQPYPMTWEHGDESHDALVKLPDGSNLSIMFSMDYGAYGDEEWTVEFWRNNSQEVTGEGDQQRIFATVLSAIQQFIKTEHPERIRFSANKAVEPGQKSQTRSNLYTKLVQRYANSWGYGVDVDDFADTTVYNLHAMNESMAEGKQPGQAVVDAILRVMPVAQEIWFHGSRATGKHRRNSDTDILVVVPDNLVGDKYLGAVRILQKLNSHFNNYDIQPTKTGTNIHRIAQEEGRLLWSKQGVAENFADGKNPGRKGLSRRVGIPKKPSLGQLEKIAKSSSGERRRMAQWQLNMRRGKARK